MDRESTAYEMSLEGVILPWEHKLVISSSSRQERTLARVLEELSVQTGCDCQKEGLSQRSIC
jgi:hypothetical protein